MRTRSESWTRVLGDKYDAVCSFGVLLIRSPKASMRAMDQGVMLAMCGVWGLDVFIYSDGTMIGSAFSYLYIHSLQQRKQTQGKEKGRSVDR